jgi:lipoprotein-anchoring transpeptidase ErfK/SrfK
MTVHSASHRSRARRRLAALTSAVLLSAAAISGCSAKHDSISKALDHRDSSPSAPAKTVSSARLSTNLPETKNAVSVDTLLHVTASKGTLKHVSFHAGKTQVRGSMSGNGRSWTAGDRLEPGTTYQVSAVAVDSDGLKKKLERTFRTVPLSLDQQTYPSIAPVQGETVGVGMPIIVHFDVPVTDRASIERHLSVQTKPVQQGTWHWISDNEVHWRPKTYWKAGTDVTVHADINGVSAGNGIFGQMNRAASFHIGNAVIMKINLATHEMRVFDNGKLLRTIPVTGGAAGFTTRSGIKVIIEKFRVKRMNSATVGIKPGDPNYYNIPDVEYAQRVTYSGEFLHAAPWSVGDQGSANVSHGCVGMSTENAAWLYGLTHRGDVVDVSGTSRPMEPDNGYGDWNVPWNTYKAGSALH